MVFFVRANRRTQEGVLWMQKGEKKEEHYKGKEVKGKLEKKKEEYYMGEEVKGEK
jgi:hypothetical protein